MVKKRMRKKSQNNDPVNIGCNEDNGGTEVHEQSSTFLVDSVYSVLTYRMEQTAERKRC
jgi:hypothetical protein